MAATFKKSHALSQPLLLNENEESASDALSPKQTFSIQALTPNKSPSTSHVELEHMETLQSMPLILKNKENPFQHKTMRSQTYQGDMGNGNFFRQATLKHLSFHHLEDDEDMPLAPKITRVISKYAMDNVRSYELSKGREFERQNFDAIDNEIAHLESLKLSLRGRKMPSRGLLKWFTCIIIGVMTGMCMVFVTFTVGKLQHVLWNWYKYALQSGFGAGFGVFLGFSLLMAFIAGGAVFVAPRAAGSGIPEVKAYLNGSSIPSLFYLKTLVAKLIGVIGAVAGSFMVGKEGPMVCIHFMYKICVYNICVMVIGSFWSSYSIWYW